MNKNDLKKLIIGGLLNGLAISQPAIAQESQESQYVSQSEEVTMEPDEHTIAERPPQSCSCGSKSCARRSQTKNKLN